MEEYQLFPITMAGITFCTGNITVSIIQRIYLIISRRDDEIAKKYI